MAATALRPKHVRIGQAKLDKAKKELEARTDAEAHRVAPVVSESEVDAVLRSARGKTRLKTMFA